MPTEARLEAVESGLAPTTPGWFCVNARDVAWLTNDDFGGVCIFESDDFVLDGRPDLEEQTFTQLGFTLRVLMPGKPNGMYHAETDEEDFLVLSGECLLLIEDEERHLRAWDFVHCPRATRAHLRGRGRRPVRDPGGGRKDGRIEHRLSALGGRAPPWRECRDGGALGRGGLRDVREMEPRPPAALERAALGRVTLRR